MSTKQPVRNRWPQGLTLVAYGYQSGAALALVLAVSWVLPAWEYGAYSLAVATVQFISVAAFEWLRVALMRFSAAPEGGREGTRMATAAAWFIGLGIPIVLLVALSWTLTGNPVFSLIGGLSACLWGWTDLQVTATRYRGDLARSAFMQVTRATLLVVGAVAGAVLGTAATAFAGLTAALAVTAVLFSLMDPVLRRFSLRQASWPQSREFLSYGVPAASASTIHLLLPVALRWLIVGIAGPVVFAGVALAIDLLQRPFAVALTAFHNLLFPEVIRVHDHEPRRGAEILRQYYENQIWVGFLVAGAVVAVLPEAAAILVDPAYRLAFGATAVSVTLIYLFRSWLQNTVSAAALLAKRPGTLVRTAGLEFAVVLGAAAAVAYPFGGTISQVMAAAAAGTCLTLLMRLPAARIVPVSFPTLAVVCAASASLLMASLHNLRLDAPIISLLAKLVLAGLIGSGAYMLWYRKSRAVRSGGENIVGH